MHQEGFSFPGRGIFPLSTRGAIRHWRVSPLRVTAYEGPGKSDEALRESVLPDPPACPEAAGEDWHPHDAGRNEFIEFTKFYHRPASVEVLAETELIAPEAGEISFRFWVSGGADLWVNGRHIWRLKVVRYHQSPGSVLLTFPLQAGVNRIQVRLQAMGLRDTRMLFGLFAVENIDLKVGLPAGEEFKQVQQWLYSLRPQTDGSGVEAAPAPGSAEVTWHGGEAVWKQGDTAFRFPSACPDSFQVRASVGSQTLERHFELPGNCPDPRKVADRRKTLLNSAATLEVSPEHVLPLPLLARRIRGETLAGDAALFRRSLDWINTRLDCADFQLAALLRMAYLGLLQPEESAALRECCLEFRYGPDESGTDVMCFTSENHRLLFHGCQLLAGNLYPDAQFRRSGRSGSAQSEIARGRIEEWLEEVEARGFGEYNSSCYIAITVGAMLNVLDFGGDVSLSERMQALVDRVLRDLARHYFAGGIISPQGRAYRDVLYPEAAASVHLLAAVCEEVVFSAAPPAHLMSARGLWTPFLLSSPCYQPPPDLDEICREPHSEVSVHGGMEIHLEKTDAYLLTSAAVRNPGTEGVAAEYHPGGFGYQQHLWQATLGRGCHIFVNHPGGYFDGSLSRPGYWNGNGVMPTLTQQGNMLKAVYCLPDGSGLTAGEEAAGNPDPVPFTHAHWPSDRFEEELVDGQWRFGRYERGLIALWCSVPLQVYDDVLTGRELRAPGAVTGWVVICGDLKAEGSLAAFARVCQAREPQFEKEKAALCLKDAEPMSWR
ncbi:hypothetical protein P0Y35_07925 [Kiritimatiellaeota bacterium B1221]|nr:hypothetical protein [Kiritimatiellaeota bacterium B1221]